MNLPEYPYLDLHSPLVRRDAGDSYSPDARVSTAVLQFNPSPNLTQIGKPSAQSLSKPWPTCPSPNAATPAQIKLLLLASVKDLTFPGKRLRNQRNGNPETLAPSKGHIYYYTLCCWCCCPPLEPISLLLIINLLNFIGSPVYVLASDVHAAGRENWRQHQITKLDHHHEESSAASRQELCGYCDGSAVPASALSALSRGPSLRGLSSLREDRSALRSNPPLYNGFQSLIKSPNCGKPGQASGQKNLCR
ncbi:uncharacterized protein LOC106955168 [Poecilia latipinna]|uniref:uncharacterized protein LOC106955168 n=1 Tax=Poecilia latipinna TaxID=48699 RepID=UPI00072EEEF7|nr:PREDICTED: uncharacterized protein LOC106955168 [Poecilia latipinna]